MLKFNDAKLKFERARDKSRGYRLPGRNGATRLVKVNSTTYGIQLYDTIVVRIHKDNTYSITPEGWTSKTTRDRIGYYSPVSISSNCGKLFLHSRTRIIEFTEGIRVNSKGMPVSKRVKTWTHTEFYGKYDWLILKDGWKPGMHRRKLLKRGHLHLLQREHRQAKKVEFVTRRLLGIAC